MVVMLLALSVLVGCTVSVEYSEIVVTCYDNESKDKIYSVMHFDMDKVLNEDLYEYNALSSKSIIKNNEVKYSKKDNNTYVVHGDKDSTYTVEDGKLKTEDTLHQFCFVDGE